MTGLGEPGPCDHCSAPIMWLLTANDRRMPVDAKPDPDRGNVLRQGDRAAVLGKGPAAGARAAGQQLRTHHAITCPYASRWQKRVDR